MATVKQKARRMERQLENACVKWAKGAGWISLKMNVMGQRGWPDRMFIKGGKVVFVEFKAPSKKPNKLQANMLQTLRNAGMYAFWNSDFVGFAEAMITIEGGIDSEGHEAETDGNDNAAESEAE